MTFENFKGENNAETTFDGGIGSTSTTIIVNTGEGVLFPTTFPFLLTFEKYNTSNPAQIIGREIVKVTASPATDQFTIIRQYASCVQDETVNPKVLSNGPQTFASGDKISLYNTKENDLDIKTELIRIETDKLDKTTYNAEKNVYGASSEGTDAYKITDASIISYSEINIYKVKADVANTGTCTFEINSLGAKAVKKVQGTIDLEDGDWGASGIAYLQYNSTLDVFQYSSQVAVAVSADDITGVMKQWAGTTAPSGYFLCDGQAISRTTYADLFAITGTLYGIGDGSTTFNIPNLKGRIPVGKDTGTFSTLGGTGGSETHTLITSETPAHTHNKDLYDEFDASNGSTKVAAAGNTFRTSNVAMGGSVGGGGSHNNLQPYQVVNHIIKF